MASELAAISMSSFRGSQNFVWDMSKPPLGQGATCVVHMGRNKKTGEEVAVKVFNAMSYQRPFAVQMREFDVMKRLNHENIVKLLAIEEEVPNNSRVIVMEYCTHGSLYHLLDTPDNSHGLTEDEFLSVLRQVSAGVKNLRDNDIIHRDIKPGNILRSAMPDGKSVYKLTDFGAARELQEEEEFQSLYGTDEYLHPDMYEKAVLRKMKGQQFGVYVDLWSLGVTFYHAATGSLPFRPYGGRKNKSTMHMITTEKESGVISGVQLKEGGSIEWSRDLPATCRLSRGLKSLLAPLLAVLLEKAPEKTPNFEEIFERVNDITSRVQLHMFCPPTVSIFTVYARPQFDISHIQQHIRDQTGIPEGTQLLLHDGKALQIRSRETVAKSLKTSKENPVFVFNKLPEFRPFIKPSVGALPEISLETNVDMDYHLSKKCLAALYSLRNAVRVIVAGNKLMDLAVKTYSNHVSRIFSEVELSMGHVVQSCSNTRMYKDQLFAMLAVQVSMFRLLAESNLIPSEVDVVSRINMLQTIQQTGSRECSQIDLKLQEKLTEATATLEDMKMGRPLEANWNPQEGCLPTDRCIEKMDALVQRMVKIMSSFREDRTKRQLTNNDEQIHRVDKNKLKELCITAQTLLDDHCVKRAQSLFLVFKSFYSKGVQINDTAEKLSASLTDISCRQTRLIDKLKASGTQCITETELSLKVLETQDRNKNNCADSDRESDKNTSDRQIRLGTMIGSIANTTSNLAHLNDMLRENSSIMKRINTELEETELDDVSWVDVKMTGELG